MTRLTRIICSLPMALAAPADAAQPLTSEIARAIHDVDPGGATGFSIGVDDHGTIAFGTSGYANRPLRDPITPETIFHVASVSKYILAAVILQLVDQGRVRLDDDIRAYVSEAPTQGRRVTIAELLSNSSGIHSFTARPDAQANEGLDLDHAQVLRLFADTPFDFEPGTSWRYDNSGFYLAGMLVERVTREPYARYVREHLFGPLHMTTASLCDDRDPPIGLAPGHVAGEGGPGPAPRMSWRLPFAAGGLCATARDLVTFERALDEGRIVSSAMLARMRSPTVLPGGVRIDYGLGTRLGALSGHPVVGHTGNGGGYTAILEHFPRDDLTIVVLANSDPAPVNRLATMIARAALTLPRHRPIDRRPPAHLIEALAGRYESDDGSVEQRRCGWHLCVNPAGANEAIPLFWQHDAVFALDADHQVRFTRGTDSSNWGQLYEGGMMTDAKRRTR